MSMETAGERARNLPEIIQGGMGIAVSNWQLAGSVAATGEMGIVSGTVIGPVLARRLQDGDPGGHMQQALEAFPDHQIADDIIKRYYLPGGRQLGKPYKAAPMIDAKGHHQAETLNMAGSFVEVWLAKQLAKQNVNKSGPVGMNLLTKLQPPTLSALFGAMLAEADNIIMGAGIPDEIPQAINDLFIGNEATIKFDVTGTKAKHRLEFDSDKYPLLRDYQKSRPAFLAIVASNILAKVLASKDVPPDGFVIEGPTAGGHNAPPRIKKVIDERGQPVYGERDVVNLKEVAELGLPFWLAGSYGSPEGLEDAIWNSANGIQVGSAFALSSDSGLSPRYREYLIDKAMSTGIDIYTDMRASPTGFPFKIPSVEGTLSEIEVYEARERVCDLGYLREAYAIPKTDGTEVIGYRCASEPVEDYIKKGGDLAATIGRKCLCNGLMAVIELGQIRNGQPPERSILTIGDNANETVQRIVPIYGRNFSAADVVSYLRSGTK